MDRYPTVSVVMPVYNREEMVGRAIDSILDQTFRDFELIVVDDGSTDRTPSIVRSYSDPRVTCMVLPANVGTAGARSEGNDRARGEFIAIMDSDDIALPERLGRQVGRMRAIPAIDILATNIVKCQPGGRFPQQHAADDGTIKARLLNLDGSAMIHPTTMIRKSFIDRHGLRYRHGPTDDDHAFWIDALGHGARFAVLQEFLLEYHRHDSNSMTRDGALETEHQRRKTPMRAHLLGLFFPGLTENEALSIACWMEKGRRHSRQEVRSAVAAIRKALTDSRSHLGESKGEIFRILAGHCNSALAALRRQRSRAAAVPRILTDPA